MVRTRQTARQSTGGMAPRRQVASGFGSSYRSTGQDTLVGIYKDQRTRSIALDGTDEFEVDPDLINLSFLISDEEDSYQAAIRVVLTKLDEVRGKIFNMGIHNEAVSCDSLSVQERIATLQDGKEVVSDSDEEDSAEDNAFMMPRKSKKDSKGKANKKTKVTMYIPKIVIRVRLEDETIKLFGTLMFTLLQMGLVTYEAPLYESTEITQHRNKARENAIMNAKDRAHLILNGLGDDSISLGNPLTINDINCAIEDDSLEAFTGNSMTPWFIDAPVGKRKFAADSTMPLFTDDMASRMNDLFVIPKIRIIARIQVIFEILGGDATTITDDGEGEP